ncbi:hypothetical protein ACLKA7_001809 [Drosophila subpalustris]
MEPDGNIGRRYGTAVVRMSGRGMRLVYASEEAKSARLTLLLVERPNSPAQKGLKYLHKYRHEDSPECPTCPSASEDPEHVLYYCTRYRGRAGVVPPPESLMAFMLATEDNWSSTSQLIIGIQRDLRRCERERRERSDA